MKYVILLGKQSKDFSDLNCLASNLISTFWYAYYGSYQGNLPKEVLKTLNGNKGIHYNLEPLKIPAEIVPIYQDNEMVFIIQLYSKPENVVKDLFNILSLTRQKDFWDMIIKYDNIVEVKVTTKDGMQGRSYKLGMDKKVYDKVVKQILEKQKVQNIDMFFVYPEEKLPFTMLNINLNSNSTNNEWMKAIEKGINPNVIRFALGINTDNDDLTQTNLDVFCRNIRQAIMLMCGCNNVQEVANQMELINQTEKNNYENNH